MTPWTVAHQAPLSMGSPRQEYWSGSPFPFPGGLPDPGIDPRSPALQVVSLPTEPPGKPRLYGKNMSFCKKLTACLPKWSYCWHAHGQWMGLPRWHSDEEFACQRRRCGLHTWDTTERACSVVVCLCFNLCFTDEWCGTYFHLLICHLCISLGRCLFRSFAHLKIRLVIFLLLSFKSSLYILDNSLLSAVFFFFKVRQDLFLLRVYLKHWLVVR